MKVYVCSRTHNYEHENMFVTASKERADLWQDQYRPTYVEEFEVEDIVDTPL